MALGEQRLSWRQGRSPQQCTQGDSGEGSGRRSRSCDGGGPGLRYCWQGKAPQSPGRPHEALPYGTEALFRVLGRHSAHQGGDAGSVTGPTETQDPRQGEGARGHSSREGRFLLSPDQAATLESPDRGPMPARRRGQRLRRQPRTTLTTLTAGLGIPHPTCPPPPGVS